MGVAAGEVGHCRSACGVPADLVDLLERRRGVGETSGTGFLRIRESRGVLGDPGEVGEVGDLAIGGLF